MTTKIKILFLFLFQVSTSVLSLEFMGRALSYDWHFKQHKLPPLRETIELPSHITDNSKIEILAFGKRWSLELKLNNILISQKTRITERILKDYSIVNVYNSPTSCLFIGTATADQSEFGLVSISTCGGELHGLISTNLNDYVIFHKGWRMENREKRSSTVKVTMTISNFTVKPDEEDKQRWKRRAGPLKDEVHLPKLQKLEEPNGRRLFLELGIVVDKHYMRDFSRLVSNDRNDLITHIIHSYNDAQQWYLHPTLGFQIWITIKDIIVIDDDLPTNIGGQGPTTLAALCRFAKLKFPENASWDEIVFMSSKEQIWHGRVGLAQRAGVCSAELRERCAGISHINFQPASLARLIAHEVMHPLGVIDDYEGPTSRVCFTGVMRRGVWQDHDWSSCSVQNLEQWIQIKSSRCITRHQTRSLHIRAKPPQIAVNVAWRAEVVQSSTYHSELDWGAWKATDGPISGVPTESTARHGSCTHTLREDKPWIKLKLNDIYSRAPVHRIVIYNRDDCCDDRLVNFEVRVGDYEDFTKNRLCFHHTGVVQGGANGAAVIECTTPNLSGRYVSVQLMNKSSVLTVCELQVFKHVPLGDFDNSDISCTDEVGFCPYWASQGECTRPYQDVYMKQHCAYSCNICNREETTSRERTTTNRLRIYPVTRVPSNDCQDKHESCIHFAAAGDCAYDYEMRKRCPKSCGFCPTRSPVATQPPTRPPTIQTTVKTIHSTVKPAFTTVKPTFTTVKPTFTTVKPTATTLSTTKRSRSNTTGGSTVNISSTPTTVRTATPEEVIDNSIQNLIESSRCLDENRYCNTWADAGYCSSSSMVPKICPNSCNTCHLTNDEEETATLGPQTTTTQQSDPNCQDMKSTCTAWKRLGHCTAKSVQRTCPRSCGVCP